MYLCSVNKITILITKNMRTKAHFSRPYPDFRALLKSVMESGRRMDENYARYLKDREERESKLDAEKKERDAKWEQERDEFRKRMDKISADTNRAIKDMKNVFTTQWGRLVEALCKPAALKLFKDLGIGIHNIYKEGESIKSTVDGEDKMEVDVLLENCDVVVAVEVKTTCSVEDVQYFIQQMKRFKYFFPRFGERTVYAAMAAINYKGKSADYARKHGLFTLKMSGEETFTMLKPEIPMEF